MSQTTTVKLSGMHKFLEGFVVFFCGVKEAKIQKAKEVVVWYGGKCVDKFGSSVTCGIVERVGASGFKDLLSNKIKIVSLRWLSTCAENRALVPMDAAAFKVSPFHGLVVVCTQLTQEERDRIENLVVKNGGTFSMQFVSNQCTHLIAKTTTDDKLSKYVAAKNCRTVHIVTSEWVEKCAQQKAWVPEFPYSVELLARRALKLQQENNQLKASTSTAIRTSEPCDNTKTLHVVEEMERVLITDTPVASLPSFLCVPTEAQSTFEGRVFWIQGYNQEVHK